MSARQLIRELKLNLRVIEAQTAGLRHEDSLLQPPMRGNCMNWVLGHLVHNRGLMLAEVKTPTPWEPGCYDRYGRDSAPVDAAADAQQLESLLGALRAAQELLLAKVEEIDEGDWVTPDANGRTLGDRLQFLSWHETFHAGQLEFLRQLAGTNDKVI
jgi:hypothetical protein